MKLGTELHPGPCNSVVQCLGPGHTVLDEDSAPASPQKGDTAPSFPPTCCG